jgi:hypothetical protein
LRPGLSIIALDAHLDEFVCGQCAVGLSDNGFADAGIAQHHDRVQVMSGGSQGLSLGWAQAGRHPHRLGACVDVGAVGHGFVLK